MPLIVIAFSLIISALLLYRKRLFLRKHLKKLLSITAIIFIGLLALRGGHLLGSIIGFIFLVLTLLERFTRILDNKHIFQHLFKTLHGTRQSYNNNSPTGAMSKQEAMEILGITETASKDEIKQAYYKLMEKNHPDKGGSKYIATKLNQARDSLLN